MITLNINGIMPNKCSVSIDMNNYRNESSFKVIVNESLEVSENYEYPHEAYNALQGCLSKLFYSLPEVL